MHTYLFSTVRGNMNNISSCSVKSTYVAFLVLIVNNHSFYSTRIFTRYMAPSSSSNSTTSTFATMAPQLNHNHTVQTTGTSGNAFGSYQLLVVGTSVIKIRYPLPLPMPQLSYYTAILADLFFETIYGCAMNSTFSSVDTVETIAGYFGSTMISAEE